ncbi:hypothetical protein lerEdw1_001694 [Lerista edwardsae]|nr:hypothetical protein lerEdw1_001694 [Lerista edwardsae]
MVLNEGLELQETSCHTAEAHRVDEVFELAFEQEGHAETLFLNHHFGNILTPCTLLPVKLYSDARNVLSGIIDSPENRKQLKDDFIKILLWVLIQHSYRLSKRPKMFGGTPKAKQESPAVKSAEVLNTAVGRLSSRKDDGLSVDSLEDWTDDSNLFDAESSVPKAKGTAHREGAPRPFFSLPGSIEIHTTKDEPTEVTSMNKLYKTVVLGLPAVDTGKHGGVVNMPPLKFSSPYSELLSLPEEWRNGPLPVAKLREMKQKFPDDWFHFVLHQLEYFHWKENRSQVLEGLIQDTALRDLYVQGILSCYIGMFGLDDTIPSPGHIFRAYNGGLP